MSDLPSSRLEGEPRIAVYPGTSIDARFVKGMKVNGPRLRLREAIAGDAIFILGLRLDPLKNQFLSAVESNIDAQAQWIRSAYDDPAQLYFIIEVDEQPVGTVRLYDQRRESFCWGSWILDHRSPKSSAVESTLMVYTLGLSLGFKAAHFDVRKGNTKVWRYHERLGAKRVSEDDENYYYVMHEDEIRSVLTHYKNRGSIEVVFPAGKARLGDPTRRKD